MRKKEIEQRLDRIDSDIRFIMKHYNQKEIFIWKEIMMMRECLGIEKVHEEARTYYRKVRKNK